MPKIFLKFNERVLKEIPLDKPRFTIGRKPDNDLVIDNPVVSGHHALIVSEEGVFFIEDLGSTNGTFVNDAKIQKEKLKNSDCIIVGKRSEEHTSELQSLAYLVCRLLLEKKKKKNKRIQMTIYTISRST